MFEKVCKMLADQLNVPVESIKPESEVVKDLGADSLDVVELMMALEDEYGIALPESEVESVKTVQDIVDMMNKIANSFHFRHQKKHPVRVLFCLPFFTVLDFQS